MFNKFVSEPLKHDLILDISFSFPRSVLKCGIEKDFVGDCICLLVCETSICELLWCANGRFLVNLAINHGFGITLRRRFLSLCRKKKCFIRLWEMQKPFKAFGRLLRLTARCN